jgi:hypothetical protein
MKTKITNSSLILILAASGVAFFAGCASMETNNNTKSLLSAAGFRVRTPQTAKQQELYAALPNNKVEHAIVKGKVFTSLKTRKPVWPTSAENRNIAAIRSSARSGTPRRQRKRR